MKIALIVPYIGEFPNYFQLFLNSCKYNNNYTWLIYTDNDKEFDYPDNVIKKIITFDELKKLIYRKLNYNTLYSLLN